MQDENTLQTQTLGFDKNREEKLMTLSWLSALNVKDRCIVIFKNEHVTI
jgi:hypothetical protein